MVWSRKLLWKSVSRIARIVGSKAGVNWGMRAGLAATGVGAWGKGGRGGGGSGRGGGAWLRLPENRCSTSSGSESPSPQLLGSPACICQETIRTAARCTSDQGQMHVRSGLPSMESIASRYCYGRPACRWIRRTCQAERLWLVTYTRCRKRTQGFAHVKAVLWSSPVHHSPFDAARAPGQSH